MPWARVGDRMTGEILFDTDPTPLARASDPATSHRAAKSAAIRSGSQKHTLLRAYAMAGGVGLTDEEAASVTRLDQARSCCWWKRCSELRQAGYISDTGRTRTSVAGEQRMVCEITAAGRAAVAGYTHQVAA